MTSQRERPRTDAFIVLGGLTMIAWAFLNLKYHVTGYLPGDIRGEPWFDPFVSFLAAAIGVLMILFGTIRLMQALRHKH
jgi:hypothetical protein